MTDAPKPAPCPWCGFIAHAKQSYIGVEHWVACAYQEECGVTGPVRATEAAATAAWNRVAKEPGHE